MSDPSPWAPRPPEDAADGPAADGSGADAPVAGEVSRNDVPPSDRREGTDPVLALGAAIVLAALAGICALLGAHFVIGALRLVAGVLAGAALAAGILALPMWRALPGRRALLAGGLGLALAVALTLPAVLAAHVPWPVPEATRIDPLGQGDRLLTVPAPDAPAVVRRADRLELLRGTGVRTVPRGSGESAALAADGTRLVLTDGETTRVLDLDPTLSTPDGLPPEQTLLGAPLSLTGDVLVLHSCAEGLCTLRGVDLTAGEKPLWTLTALEGIRGADAADDWIPATGEPPRDLAASLEDAGIVPTVPLRVDEVQGWFQLDPTTGVAVGRRLAGPEEDCRIAATAPEPVPAPTQADLAPVVLTACTGEDGALTATAFRDGEALWTSDPSPAGQWEVMLDGGRVLARGTEAGSDVVGEIVASSAQAAWTAPGGQGLAEVSGFRSRLGIDEDAMVVVNEAGQLVAYDTADGAEQWALPLSIPGADGAAGEAPDVRGAVAAGAVVVLDPLPREHPLDPRDGRRLRLVDAEDGTVLATLELPDEPRAVRPVGGGRALVTTGSGETFLVGP